VVRNYEIIKAILDITMKDDLVFLKSCPIPDTQFRDNAPPGSPSTSATSASPMSWEAEERKARLFEKIDKAVEEIYNDKQYMSSTWEDIMIHEQLSASSSN
jgi:ketosteroid isomerase-like protein